MSRNHSFLNMI